MSSEPIKKEIINLLTSAYSPLKLEIENESDQHSGPSGRESHFKVLIVSDFFKDMKLVERQKHIYLTLKNLMPRIHALSLRALTVDQMEKSQDFQSPSCAKGKSQV
jgi:BolA family transcriptional regulator, general stress-responsive regulator